MHLLNVSLVDYVSPIIMMLAGLGAFLIGVKIMSDSMSLLADNGLKRMFQRIENNKLVGVGIGAGSTAIIQSSAVTTVMVVGFVNAGVMSLMQATTVIMGANIGTTVTAQLAALQSFDFMQYVIILSFVGFLWMSIAKTEKGKHWGYMIAGLGLIFLALQFMSLAMVPFKDINPATNPNYEMALYVRQFLQSINNPFLLLLIGIAFTFILQSSSALTTIIISMAASGLIFGGSADHIGNGVLYIILGSNIGTCFTTMMASANTSTNAKRAALIHLLFNLFGSILFFVILVFWKNFMDVTFAKWFPNAYGTQIAMFHTFFNTFCTAVFLPFTSIFVRVSKFIIRDKAEDAQLEVMYIDDRFLATPSIAISQSKKEAKRIGDIAMQSCDYAMAGFMQKDIEMEKNVVESLQQIAILNKSLTQYMVGISTQGASQNDEQAISGLYYVLGDLLRIGDLSHNITKYTAKIASGEIQFSDSVYIEVQAMFEKIKVLYEECMECYLKKDMAIYESAMKHEDEIDEMKRLLIKNHIERLNRGDCNPASSSVFVNLVGNIERMADHMTFIAERSVESAPRSSKGVTSRLNKAERIARAERNASNETKSKNK